MNIVHVPISLEVYQNSVVVFNFCIQFYLVSSIKIRHFVFRNSAWKLKIRVEFDRILLL